MNLKKYDIYSKYILFRKKYAKFGKLDANKFNVALAFEGRK